ncbi:MAG: hypothetical protein U0W24_07130 [Bacteroidales bacterium]
MKMNLNYQPHEVIYDRGEDSEINGVKISPPQNQQKSRIVLIKKEK